MNQPPVTPRGSHARHTHSVSFCFALCQRTLFLIGLTHDIQRRRYTTHFLAEYNVAEEQEEQISAKLSSSDRNLALGAIGAHK